MSLSDLCSGNSPTSDGVYLQTEDIAQRRIFPSRCGLSKMLSSWKEIAHFFGKGVRTVQRWEKTLDLPIHRPPGAPSNVVLARTSDLEEWMHRGPVARAVSEETLTEGFAEPAPELVASLETEVARLATWAGVAVTGATGHKSLEDRIKSLTALVGQVHTQLSEAPAARAA